MHQVNDSETAHSCSAHREHLSTASAPAQFAEVHRNSALKLCVHKLYLPGNNMQHRTLVYSEHGSSPHRTQQPVANSISTPAASSTRTRTVHLGCVYINYTYPGGPVEHYYTRCMNPIPLTSVQHTVHSNL